MTKTINFIKENIFIIIILLLAGVLRFYHLDFQSLWMDEIYTMNVANPNQTFSNLISEVNLREGFPYLYFILLKILFSIFGHTAVVARLFSVVFGVLSVYAIFKLGKTLLAKNVGLIAALLLAINEYNISISQDARPYTFYLFATILSFYFLSKIIKNNSLKNAIFYGLSVGLLFSTNFFSFINVFSHLIIILFFFILTNKEERILNIKNYLISGGIAFLLMIINYKIIIKLLTFQSFWVAKPTPESFSLLFKEILGNSEMSMFIYFPLFLFFLINLFNENNLKNKHEIINNKFLYSSLIYFAWIFVFILTLYVKSYGEVSLMLTRYFTSIIPVFFLVLSSGIYLIKNNIAKFILIGTIFIFTLTNIFIIKDYYNTVNKSQYREVSDFVIKNHNNKDVVYTNSKYWFNYYLGNDKFDLKDTDINDLFISMSNDKNKIKPFWFIDAFQKTYLLNENSQKIIRENYYIDNNFDGFQGWARHFILLKDVSQTINISKYIPLKTINGDKFNLNLEFFEIKDNKINASGWAYFDNQDSNKTVIDIVLIKDNITLKMQTLKVDRPDTTIYFKSKFNLNNAGFSSTYDSSGLKTGVYSIGIYLFNKETKKEGLFLTDKFFEKK